MQFNSNTTTTSGLGVDTAPATIWMMTYVIHNLPTSLHHAYVCSSGSKGYCALKEMLQNGIPGNTLLLESDDLRSIGSDATATTSKPAAVCCLVYTIESMYDEPIDYSTHISPTNVSHITLYSNLRVLPIGLLRNCSTLTTIDLSPMTLIRSIQDEFLMGCTGLSPTVDITPLSNIISIPASFLAGCTGLKELDLAPFSFNDGDTNHCDDDDDEGRRHLNGVIGDGFLEGCSGLASIILSPLSNVDVIYDNFLRGCSGLIEVDLSPLTHLTEINHAFLGDCTGLRELDLSPLSNVTELYGGAFLMGCTGLRTLDLSPLCQLQDVYHLFLAGCTGLEPPLDITPLSNLTCLYDSFLAGCTGLLPTTVIDITLLPNVSGIIKSSSAGLAKMTFKCV